MVLKIVVATRNRKKVEEIGRIMEGFGVDLLSIGEFPDAPEVEETGETFEENALLKARAIALHTGLAALADDSGLAVDALGGEPGVRSARYSGEGATDESNLKKLLRQLEGVSEEKRTGRFLCVIALACPPGAGGGEKIFGGTVEGRIGFEPRGDNGFGYDPVFFPEGRGETFAEMSSSEKDSYSHRGRALGALSAYLSEKEGEVCG